MQRLIFINRYFFPDHSATSQILSDLAFHLAAEGREVHVVTSRQLYDRPAARLPDVETVRGVKIHRVATTRFGRSTLPGRAIDYLSFYAGVWRALSALARGGDILIAKTDPPLLSIVVSRVARRRNAHLVNWLQDIYPDIAIRLGVPALAGPVGKLLSRLRDSSFAVAAANVVVSQRMADYVGAHGARAGTVHVVPNWCDDRDIGPVLPTDNPLRRTWGLEGKFVVGYSGNLGRAHEYETIVAAAERLNGRNDIVFLFVGGGHQFNLLAAEVRRRGLGGLFHFAPYQEQAMLKYALSAPDAHWISLKPELEGLIFPSKFYGVAAAGRPMIAIAAPEGEIAALVRQYDCGVVVVPGEGDMLAHEIVALASDAGRLAAMGQRARAMLQANFTRDRAFERWRRVLDDVERR